MQPVYEIRALGTVYATFNYKKRNSAVTMLSVLATMERYVSRSLNGKHVTKSVIG